MANSRQPGMGHHVTFHSTHGGRHWPYKVKVGKDSFGVVIKSSSGRWAGKRYDRGSTQGPWYDTRREAAAWLIYGDRREKNPMRTMSFGEMPPRDVFRRAFESELGEDGTYNIRAGAGGLPALQEALDRLGIDGDVSRHRGSVDLDEDELWDVVMLLKEMWPEDEEDDDDCGAYLASDIMSTLDFEWV